MPPAKGGPRARRPWAPAWAPAPLLHRASITRFIGLLCHNPFRQSSKRIILTWPRLCWIAGSAIATCCGTRSYGLLLPDTLWLLLCCHTTSISPFLRPHMPARAPSSMRCRMADQLQYALRPVPRLRRTHRWCARLAQLDRLLCLNTTMHLNAFYLLMYQLSTKITLKPPCNFIIINVGHKSNY